MHLQMLQPVGFPDSAKNLCMCRYVGAPPPLNEAMRLQTLQAMGILDSAPEKKYEEVTKLLQHLFQAGTPQRGPAWLTSELAAWATD